MKKKVIVIGGPTATGKTALSIELAKQVDGEIISADSMLIYKGMDIGTAKPTIEEREGIAHYMIDVIEPNQRFSVADYKKGAIKAIEEILKKGKVPIIVGGTGLYIDTLIYGIDYPDIEIDLEYRKKLEERIEKEGLDKLYEEAKEIDSEAIQKISQNDQKRICRILELYQATGKTKTELEIESRKNGIPYEYHMFAINMERERLYERINKRVDIMIKNGLEREVKFLLEYGVPKDCTAMQAIGYKEFVMYLDGLITFEKAIEMIKQSSRRYAKRQLTWFRANKNINWLDWSVLQ